MDENLSDMVRDQEQGVEDVVFNESELDLPQTTAAPEESASETEEAGPQVAHLDVVSLADWFGENHEKFDNINYVRVSIRGVDPNKYLIVTVPDDDGGLDEENNPLRKLKVFESADVHPVINLPGVAMEAFNNGTFMILYKHGDDTFFKCYGIRTGLIVVACQNFEGRLLPYNIQRIRKRDTEVDIPLYSGDGGGISVKMAEPLNTETLQLRYKQSEKYIEPLNMQTNEDAINWLLSRQQEFFDVNHLLQIDSVIMDMLA